MPTFLDNCPLLDYSQVWSGTGDRRFGSWQSETVMDHKLHATPAEHEAAAVILGTRPDPALAIKINFYSRCPSLYAEIDKMDKQIKCSISQVCLGRCCSAIILNIYIIYLWYMFHYLIIVLITYYIKYLSLYVSSFNFIFKASELHFKLSSHQGIIFMESLHAFD